MVNQDKTKLLPFGVIQVMSKIPWVLMNMCRHFTPPFFQPTATQRGFYYRALKTWNNLSVSTKNSRSISLFKKSVKREMGNGA